VPAAAPRAGAPEVSVVVPVTDNLVCTRLALESVLANTSEPHHEVVVVDNSSGDRVWEYLEVLAARNRHVRLIRTEDRVALAAAWNRGVRASGTDRLVLLNGDTIVPPGWLTALSNRLDDPELGIVVPMTNRRGGAAQVAASYTAYEEMLRFARERAESWDGRPAVDIEVAEMFCAGIPGEVFASVGPFDERDESRAFANYARRVSELGYRVVYVEEVFVHRFGESESLDDRGDAVDEPAAGLEADSDRPEGWPAAIEEGHSG
jgi:GT2 family glycosyltransferase